MKALGRMRIGIALGLAMFLAVLGIGHRSDAKPGNPNASVGIRSSDLHVSRAPTTGPKSTFTVDGVPLVVDEETVIYA